MSSEAPALTALDEQMRATRAAIDEEAGEPPRVVTGWIALWSVQRYDDDGDALFGWTYAVDPNADPLRALGTPRQSQGVAARGHRRRRVSKRYVCSTPGCPTISDQPRCTEHRREAWRQLDQQRGSRQERGYGTEHDRLRREWAPKVATGNVRCWRCGRYIAPGEAWDLGHHDEDRSRYRGPEHANQCNRSAAGKRAHRRHE